jgi:2-alkenal reductase
LRFHTLLTAALASGVLALAACGAPTPVAPAASNNLPMAAVPVSLSLQQAQPTPTPVSADIISAADAEYIVLTNIYERVAPSVVNIEATFENENPVLNEASGGSGFVYDMDGHIVTNTHVIQNASEIRVTFNDGYVTGAELVGLDTYSDLAVIRVEVDAVHLHPVTMGDSEAVRVGERAIAIGNPFGLASSMTVGIVSGLGRQLPSAQLLDLTNFSGFQNPSIIQVDTEINPGNSGGPLLNSRGEVVGINTAISTETGVFQGIGFAVPARTLQRVIPDIIANGAVEYAWLGISSLSANLGYGLPALAEPLNLPVTAGVLVDTVTADSPAARAGLQGGTRAVVIRGAPVCVGGDIIIAVNGEYVANMDELLAYLVANGRPGDTLNLLVVRGDETFELPLTLEARPRNTIPSECGE